MIFISSFYFGWKLSIPSFIVMKYPISCLFINLNVVLFVLLFNNPRFIHHGNSIGWLILAILFFVEIYELFWVLGHSLSRNVINEHVPIILFGSLTPNFISVFF